VLARADRGSAGRASCERGPGTSASAAAGDVTAADRRFRKSQWRPEPQWQHGEFVQAGAPVYAEPVDGWVCHLGGPCRDSDEREPDDPEPIWHSTRAFQPVDVECYLGRYKIHETDGERREGWALDNDIDTNDRVKPCRATDF
jgi:hypothetical protein